MVLLTVVAACGGGAEHHRAAREPTALGRLWNSGRHALGVALRHPADIVEPPPADAVGRDWVYCTSEVDARAENQLALERLARLGAGHGAPYDALVVPGYTPIDRATPQTEAHPILVERLTLALADLRSGRAPLVVVSGGNVHPPRTPVNEALQMKAWLLARGVAADQVVVEPCARHSHTNLRNTGRFLLAHGLRRALVVTSRDQAMYFGRPRSSSFDARCIHELGYVLGELTEIDPNRVAFAPSGRTFERGTDPLDP